MSIARGWIRRGLVWPALATGAVFILGVAVSLHLSAPNALAFGGCVKFCDPPPSSGSSGGSSGGGGWSTPRYVPRGPSPAERARQRREAAADVANSKGIKYRKMGDYDTAISYYKEALRLDPNNSIFRENMGVAINAKGLKYHDSRDYDTAIQYFEEALRYRPNDSVIGENIRIAKAIKVNDIGLEYFKKEDYERALQYFKQALQHDPDDTTIQQNIRNAKANLQEQREKQVRERKLAESKTKVRRMLDNMSEEFGSSTLPKGSLGFMSPRKPLFAKGSSSEGLQFMDPRQEEQTKVYMKRGVVLALPNKPRHKKGGMITDPGAKLKSAEKTGKWAKKVGPTGSMDFIRDEQASGRAGIGFDTPGFKEDPLDIDDSEAPPVRGAPVSQAVLRIPKRLENRKEAKLFKKDWERMNQQIRKSENKLAAVRKQISQTKDKAKVSKLRLEESNIKAEVLKNDYDKKVLQLKVNNWAINLGGDGPPEEPASSPTSGGTPQPASDKGN